MCGSQTLWKHLLSSCNVCLWFCVFPSFMRGICGCWWLGVVGMILSLLLRLWSECLYRGSASTSSVCCVVLMVVLLILISFSVVCAIHV